jgi:hypothetical protein
MQNVLSTTEYEENGKHKIQLENAENPPATECATYKILAKTPSQQWGRKNNMKQNCLVVRYITKLYGKTFVPVFFVLYRLLAFSCRDFLQPTGHQHGSRVLETLSCKHANRG